MATSQNFLVPISYHATASFTNWAGVILDWSINPNPVEAQFVGAQIPPPWGGSMGNMGGVPAVTVWNPVWSGSTNTTSVVVPVATLQFHALNTSPAFNSETVLDITFSAWNIWHHPTVFESSSYAIPPSVWLYVHPDQTVSDWGVGEYGPEPGLGTWVHNEFWKTFHVTQTAVSWFFATGGVVGQGGIDVMHIPEPAAAGMLLLGLGTLFVARRRRAR
jgi:hypothetical protein